MILRVPFNDLSRAGDAADLTEAIRRVLDRGHFVLGPEGAAFEQEFAAFCGVGHCVGVASGSDALELALRAVGVGPDDEIVTVANASMYSTLAILACGARPVYADVDEATLTMAPAAVARVLSGRTRAVIATHLYGRLADVAGVRAVAGQLPVIEDCAQAHGARNEQGAAGALATLACFSFYPTKNLGAVGDGGAVTTGDPALAARLRALRQYGWQQKYRVTVPGGRNSRLDEVQAAVLRQRLPQLPARNRARQAIGRAYAERIRHAHIRVMPPPRGDEHIVHLAVVRSDRRDDLRAHLERAGVMTDVHYPVPDHRQPVMLDRARDVALPVTERACEEVLTLPCFPELSAAEVDHVIAACNAWPV